MKPLEFPKNVFPGFEEKDIDYLQQRYPWFSREEILNTIDYIGPHPDRIIGCLDLKSGNWTFLDVPEF